jgi:hypothetical protein
VSRDRGVRLQNALAAYLRTWWPDAESAGAGRQGRDVLHTPGVWFENKATADGEHRPGQFMRQAVKGAAEAGCGSCPPGALPCANYDLPVVVWWPPGIGKARPDNAIAMVPLDSLMHLLELAEYTPPNKDVIV